MSNLAEDPGADALVQEARRRGAYAHVVDGVHMRDKLSVMDGIAAAMSFPDWFGRNLDALYDCLTDLGWLPSGEHVLIWVSSGTLAAADPKGYLAIRSVLSDAQRAMGTAAERPDDRQFTVLLTDY